MNPRVTHVEAQENYTLNVTFQTGDAAASMPHRILPEASSLP